VVDKKGSENRNADALSRIHVTTPASENKDNVPRVNQEDKARILRELHENPTGCRLGMNSNYERIKFFVSWPGVKQEIEDYVRRCEISHKNKITQNKTKMPLQITTTPDVVSEKYSLDIVGPLTTAADGNKYLLTFQDELPKFTLAVPIQQKDGGTAEEVVLQFEIPQVFLKESGQCSRYSDWL
jgi:hypothetical protein